MPKAKTKLVNPSLFELELLEQPVTYDLVIQAVPANVALFDDAYHIVSIRQKGDKIVAKYQIPGQWRHQEVSILYEQIRGVGWQLKEDDHFEGRPYQNDTIHEICKLFCIQLGVAIY